MPFAVCLMRVGRLAMFGVINCRHIQDYVVQYEWAHSLKSHASQYPEDAIFASLHGKEHK